MNRRELLQSVGAVLVVPAESVLEAARQSPAGAREAWIGLLRRLTDPVLTNLAAETLRLRMPVEQAAKADRRAVTHLEALGRLLAGAAPWIELGADGSD